MPIKKQPACCRRVTVGGHEQLIIETAEGQRITLQDGAPVVIVEDSIGNSVRMENGSVTVRAVGSVVIQAATVQVVASQIELNAPMVQCTGILQAAEVIANTVSASTYTPGAGNVW
jgi:hypothetical protein